MSDTNMFKSKLSTGKFSNGGPIEGKTDEDFVPRRSAPRSDNTREEPVMSSSPMSGHPQPDIVTEEPPEELVRAESHASMPSKASSVDRAGSAAPAPSRQPSAPPSYAEQPEIVDAGQLMPEPSDQESEPVISELQQQPASPAVSAADVQLENQKLRAQIDALQRLYTSGSQETKVHRIQEEVTTKAKRIKELEAKVKKLTQENQVLKDNTKKLRSRKDHDALSQQDSKSSLSKQVVSQNERIHELEIELHHAEHTIAELRHAMDSSLPAPPVRPVSLTSDGPSPPAGREPSRRGSRRGSKSSRSGSPTSETHRLREQLGDKDRIIHNLQTRLAKAQEAILSSAGVGWEAHVKLHQTRGALQKIVTSTSPERSAASLSLPPSRPGNWQPELPGRPASSRSFHGVDIKAAEDAHGRLRLWRVTGTRGMVTKMHYADGIIRDQHGEIIRSATEAHADEIPRLAALADMCSVPHNLPQSAPCVVVAGHSVSSPLSHVSSYRGQSHSPQIRY